MIGRLAAGGTELGGVTCPHGPVRQLRGRNAQRGHHLQHEIARHVGVADGRALGNGREIPVGGDDDLPGAVDDRQDIMSAAVGLGVGEVGHTADRGAGIHIGADGLTGGIPNVAGDLGRRRFHR